MTVVADASVVVKVFLAEEHSEKARRLFDVDADIIAPDLLLIEACNVFWKKTSAGELHHEDAIRSLNAIPSIVQLHPSGSLVKAALDLALAAGHPAYDCLYLALAERQNARLVTLDQRFIAAARRAGLRDRVADLAAFA